MPEPAAADGPAWWVWALLFAGVAGAVVLVMVLLVFPRLGPSASATPSGAPTATISPGFSPTASPTATAAPVPTPAPTAAPTTAPPQGPPHAAPVSDPNGPVTVAQYLYGASGEGCTPQNADYSVCPVTSALAAGLHRFVTTQPADPWCRCQNTYSSVTWTRDDSQLPAGYQGNPAYAAVTVHINFGGSSSESMILVLTQQNGWWVVADTWCGVPQNRMTAAAPQPCG